MLNWSPTSAAPAPLIKVSMPADAVLPGAKVSISQPSGIGSGTGSAIAAAPLIAPGFGSSVTTT